MIPNQLPSLDFGLGDTADMLRDSVMRFASDEIAPRAADIDRTNAFPDDLWPKLEKALVSNQSPVWFAGHSLGGAMATICAGRCQLSHIKSNPEGLFTFGSPRVGNKRYINYCKIRHYRWVNNNDIVTRVPPMWMGYSHGGTEMYLNANGTE